MRPQLIDLQQTVIQRARLRGCGSNEVSTRLCIVSLHTRICWCGSEPVDGGRLPSNNQMLDAGYNDSLNARQVEIAWLGT